MNNCKNNIRVLMIVLIICVIPPAFCMFHKTQFHVDEVWTYALSNSTNGPYLYLWRTGIGDDSAPSRYSDEEKSLEDTEGVFFEKWHTGEEFKDYITVQPNERFQYSTVFYNQSCDVHPPLYYIIIHTICSFFPDTFSKWFAFIPNLIFLIASIVLLYIIVKRLGLSVNKALFISLFWGVSRACISDAVFLRMYMMLTFIVLLSVYLHSKLFDDQYYKSIGCIFLVNLAGFLTQYYYYVFCFFLTATFCIYFLFKKKIRKMIFYGCSVLCTVFLAVLLFPSIFKHVFNGAYTKSTAITIDSFQRSFTWFKVLINDFVININERQMPLFLALLFVFILSGLIFVVFKARRNNIRTNDIKLKLHNLICKRSVLYWLLLFCTVSTACILGLIAPIMHMYEDRYYFYILPILAIYLADFLISILLKLFRPLKSEKLKKLFVCTIVIALTIISNLYPRNNYIDYDRNETDLKHCLENETCFLVLNQDLRIHAYPIYLMKSEKVYVSHGASESMISEINSFNGDHAYIVAQQVMNSPADIRSIIEEVHYEVTIIDLNIETQLGYKNNDALLYIDYTKAKP